MPAKGRLRPKTRLRRAAQAPPAQRREIAARSQSSGRCVLSPTLPHKAKKRVRDHAGRPIGRSARSITCPPRGGVVK